MKKNPTSIFLLLFFMVLGGAFLAYYYYEYKMSPRALPTYGNEGHKVLPFSFINQNGMITTEKDVEGKIQVVEYFFTTCEGICPKMNENLAKVYKRFKGDKDVVFLSHTVDPKTDTAEQMKRYASKFDADPNQWFFLTGERQQLYKQAINSYLITAVPAKDTANQVLPDFIHSEFFILVDQDKNIRGNYDGTVWKEVKDLIADIKTLKEEKERN